MTLDVIASYPHYVDHLMPIWLRLPERERGTFYTQPGDTAMRAAAWGVEAEWLNGRGHTNPVLVAGYTDVRKARAYGHDGIALLQHGAGQSYSNDRPSYPGGRDNDDVGLFLCPNLYSASRWAERYPEALVAAVGSPRVEHLPQKMTNNHPDTPPLVAVSFHWNCTTMPETRPAWAHYQKSILTDLQRAGYRVLGHSHPRGAKTLAPWYKKHGVMVAPQWDNVCASADLYITDNSSTLFEFAATGRPVVVLNAPWYRRDVRHGGRFWDWATVGLQVDDPRSIQEVVACALVDPKGVREERQRIVGKVYGDIKGATDATVNTLRAWLDDR